MPTAQEVFAETLKRIVAPRLRAEGVRGSGQSYWIPDNHYWAQVEFQKSTSSDREEVRFTVNLLVTSKAAWDERRREYSYVKDTPPPGVDQEMWDAERLAQSYYPKRPTISYVRGTRIGHLIPGVERDYWWRVTPEDTTLYKKRWTRSCCLACRTSTRRWTGRGRSSHHGVAARGPAAPTCR